MLMPFLIPKPIPRSKLLLLSWQLTGKQRSRKAARGIFCSLQWAIFGLLSQRTFPCQPRRGMLECHSHSTTHLFLHLLKHNFYLWNVFSAGTYDLDWWPLEVLDEGLYRSRRRKEEKHSWKLRHSRRSPPKVPQGWTKQGHVRGQEGAAPGDSRYHHPQAEAGRMQRQNTKYSKKFNQENR